MEANRADWRITLDGQDLTDRIRPRLVELTLTDKRAGEADELDLVLDDSDGRLALPRQGALLRLSLGWKAGADVAVGLVDKGSFTVEDVEHRGSPDRISLKARSADFSGPVRTRRERSWHDTTLRRVLEEIARDNDLVVRIAAGLADRAVRFLAQSRESDLALLRRLGREHDAVATIKAGALLFAPVGSGQTPGGRPLPDLTLRRRDGDNHSFRIAKREEAEAVEVRYHDRRRARTETARTDTPRRSASAGGGRQQSAATTRADRRPTRRLSRVYASEASARRAGEAEAGRAERQPVTFSLDLALGRADAYPEQRVTLQGFKPEIDALSWLIVEATHKLDVSGGFTTSLQMEQAAG